MKEIAISKFKATCLAVLEDVRRTRQPIRVTRFGKPVADVIQRLLQPRVKVSRDAEPFATVHLVGFPDRDWRQIDLIRGAIDFASGSAADFPKFERPPEPNVSKASLKSPR